MWYLTTESRLISRVRPPWPEAPFWPWKAHCTWGCGASPEGPKRSEGAVERLGASRPQVPSSTSSGQRPADFSEYAHFKAVANSARRSIRETADRPMTRMNDAEFAAWSPGEAMLADRSGVSLGWLEIDDGGESFAALRALPGTPNPRPRLAFHVLVIGFRCFPRTRLSLHRPADMNSFGPSPQLCVQGALLGESLTMIGKLLDHTQVQTTARYAHLARDSIQNAAARITGSIGGTLTP